MARCNLCEMRYEDEAEHANEVCFEDQVSIELFARIKQSTRVRGVSLSVETQPVLGLCCSSLQVACKQCSLTKFALGELGSLANSFFFFVVYCDAHTRHTQRSQSAQVCRIRVEMIVECFVLRASGRGEHAEQLNAEQLSVVCYLREAWQYDRPSATFFLALSWL